MLTFACYFRSREEVELAMVCFIELLGYATALCLVSKLSLAVFRFIYIFFLGDILGHTPSYKKLGEWAGKQKTGISHSWHCIHRDAQIVSRVVIQRLVS